VTVKCSQDRKNLVYHGRPKHIEVHYHFIREKVQKGEVDLLYCFTEDQQAHFSPNHWEKKSLGNLET
jgi:hypothetical protein